jgi:hypothetical protein
LTQRKLCERASYGELIKLTYQSQIEIEVLLSVYRLQSASRIDEDITAAKPAFRNGVLTWSPGNNRNLPYLFRMMHHVTNPFKQNWVMGALDPRPQTIAVFFALMLFGQLVIPVFGSRVMNKQSIVENPSGLMSETDLNYAAAEGLELEERLFVEDETRFTYDYFPKDLDYTPQR